MSVHHLDVLRFLFGDPDEIFTADAHRPAHHVRAHATASPSRRCASRRGCSPCRSRTSGPARATRASTVDIYIKWRVEGTEGVAKGTIGWPDYRRAPSTLRYCLDSAPPAASGSTPTLGHDVVPACLQRRDGAAAARACTTGKPPVLTGRDNVKTDGAGRGRLPLDGRRPLGQAVRNRLLNKQGGIDHDAGRHFHRLLPLRARGDGEEDQRPRLQHGPARPALQGHRLLDAGADHHGQGQAACARPSATTTCRSAASRATPTSSIPTRPSASGASDQLKAIIRNARALRLALRDLRDRHLQHRVATGCTTRRTRPRKASRTAAR